MDITSFFHWRTSRKRVLNFRWTFANWARVPDNGLYFGCIDIRGLKALLTVVRYPYQDITAIFWYTFCYERNLSCRNPNSKPEYLCRCSHLIYPYLFPIPVRGHGYLRRDRQSSVCTRSWMDKSRSLVAQLTPACTELRLDIKDTFQKRAHCWHSCYRDWRECAISVFLTKREDHPPNPQYWNVPAFIIISKLSEVWKEAPSVATPDASISPNSRVNTYIDISKFG